jgi:peptidoglycan-associated lipoprotein
MSKKLALILFTVMVIPGLLLTTSCAKKVVKSEPAMTEQPAAAAQPAEQPKPADMAATKPAIDEAKLKAEAAQREMMRARSMFMSEDIYFDFDSSVVKPAAQEVLQRKADWLRSYPEASVIIEGHCDERGTNAYNLALGDRRAEAAKAFMMNLGIDSVRISTISYGEERPVDARSMEEAWAKNRRAHFVLE